jgi:collagen type V/XI/XXIV/XXVII alpha
LQLPLLPPDILFQRDAPAPSGGRFRREGRGDVVQSADKEAAEDVDLVTVYTDVYNMRMELEKLRKPLGTRNNPARTCKDLAQGHPHFKDGKSATALSHFIASSVSCMYLNYYYCQHLSVLKW